MLIRTDELEADLAARDVTLIDARPFDRYARGHIPGSVNLDLFAFHWIDTSGAGLEAFARQTARLFSFCGVERGTRAVFYDDQSGMLASRGVWLLNYLSHPDARMLDGGYGKWRAEGRRVETKQNGFSPSDPSYAVDPGVMAGLEHVRASLGRLDIIDARSPEEYDGRVIRAARPGHIPGAVNIDWRLNLAADGTLKDVADLKRLYPFPRDAPLITYCQGAYRAASTFVALRRIGFSDVRVYLGSWGEWGNSPGLPAAS